MTMCTITQIITTITGRTDGVAGCLRPTIKTRHLVSVFLVLMLIYGGILALWIHNELFHPGLQFFNPEFFNQLTTTHGIVMVFGAIMPAFVGFANWMIPLQVGASGMAFTRMNSFAFWLLPPTAILLTMSRFVPGGATDAGWTLYAPLSTQMSP